MNDFQTLCTKVNIDAGGSSTDIYDLSRSLRHDTKEKAIQFPKICILRCWQWHKLPPKNFPKRKGMEPYHKLQMWKPQKCRHIKGWKMRGNRSISVGSMSTWLHKVSLCALCAKMRSSANLLSWRGGGCNAPNVISSTSGVRPPFALQPFPLLWLWVTNGDCGAMVILFCTNDMHRKTLGTLL